ncbi:nucleotide exchange factor GrpE [Luminiphilus sp.]|jgi:molecular chaperone GrpE|nr:nucleotide exchange factor GrpE [Luminiphilus sp.]MDA8827815.1 nucleotide exchange factor GrpE [Luminiphilus sp.]MDA9580703.1 nucleotide exchange factor GrpE [Luminiphilus sp.]MDA9847908.1 nucleotide exchange factor GrpE [Luminiphilus sp.]MDB2615317.1 nucleotide exchange factor GrpE [Luminiphilus sp.]
MADDKTEYTDDESLAAVGGTVDVTDEDAEPIELNPEQVTAQLEADLAEAKDAALRAQADAANVQRRAEQEVDKARKFALERFISELLPVVDNMERALEAAGTDEAVKPIVEGVELTQKSLIDALQKHGVEPVDPMGEPFDPQIAQAMSMVENPEVEPNTVIAVMQKGYQLNGRLIRPAMVMVSKAAD